MSKKIIGVLLLIILLIIGVFALFSNNKRSIADNSFSIKKGDVVFLEQYKMKVRLISITKKNNNNKYVFKIKYNNFTKEFRFNDTYNDSAILFDEYQMQVIPKSSSDEVDVSITKLFE